MAGNLEQYTYDNLHKPFREQFPKLRKRSAAYLEARRKQLPKLTKDQSLTIIDMIVAAHLAGQSEERCERQARTRSRAIVRWRAARAGVIARRGKSKRAEIVAAYETAAAAGRSMTVAELVKRFNVSRATVYRALNSKRWPFLKPLYG